MLRLKSNHSYTGFILAFLFLFNTLSGCVKTGKTADKKGIRPVNTYILNIAEPSGLCIDNKNRILWTISDTNGRIYKLSLKGEILGSIATGHRDLEGIAFINENTLAVVSESESSVIICGTDGKVKKTVKLEIEGDKKSGLEGITYDPLNSRFYVIKEKNPSELIILDSDLKIISRRKVNFARDLSGIHYDTSEKVLYMVSDEDESVIKTDLKGDVIKKYRTNIKKLEGITFDAVKNQIILISDLLRKLYFYELSE